MKVGGGEWRENHKSFAFSFFLLKVPISCGREADPISFNQAEKNIFDNKYFRGSSVLRPPPLSLVFLNLNDAENYKKNYRKVKEGPSGAMV